MKKAFKHLKQNDRDRLEALLDAGESQTEIAKILKMNKSTISREISNRKKANGIYEAARAQQKAYAKRHESKYQGMKVESDPALKAYIIEQLKQKRSPDEIAGHMSGYGRCAETGT